MVCSNLAKQDIRSRWYMALGGGCNSLCAQNCLGFSHKPLLFNAFDCFKDWISNIDRFAYKKVFKY